MQFLANENFPLDAVEAIRNLGHDVAWVRADAPGSKDRDILQRAVVEDRILLTFDKDFGDLAFQFGLPATCGIVLFRVSAISSAALARSRRRRVRPPALPGFSKRWPKTRRHIFGV